VVETLHGIMLVGASVNACCVLGSRRSRSALAGVSTLLMLAAMTDAAFRVVGLSPLLWTVILIGWGMTGAALLRGRFGAAHPGGALHLHHLLGLIVTAGQLAMHALSGPAALAAAAAPSSHQHSGSLLLVFAAGAGILFIGWSALLLLGRGRTRLERGNLAGMAAMTAAMGLMPFA
jgi:hypothetical protein